MPNDDGWGISIVNFITLIIVAIFVGMFTAEISILIFYTSGEQSANIMLTFVALLFTFSVVSAQYSDNSRIKKYKLDGQFLRASQNFILSVVMVLFIFSFSKIHILIDSDNVPMKWIGEQLLPISTPIVYLALFILFFELSTATWILLKALFQAYKKQYNEKV